MHEELRQDADFAYVYPAEDHPFMMGIYRILLNLPTAEGESAQRRMDARFTCRKMKFVFPAYYDDVDGRVTEAFEIDGFTMVIVGTDGRVAFRTDEGPWSYKVGTAWRALRAIVRKNAPAVAADEAGAVR
ncbi:MAG: hypothetical protein HYY18_21515 [Planctomycetes bacterium]|nr:hypothetical protein [Planctomycetota bacterium]